MVSLGRTARIETHLLVEGNLLHVGLSLVGQVGLAGSDGVGTSQRQVVVEAVPQGPPGVEKTLQAPAQHRLLLSALLSTAQQNWQENSEQYMPNTMRTKAHCPLALHTRASAIASPQTCRDCKTIFC